MEWITSEHQIFKLACDYDEINDWIPYAESLIDKWASQDQAEVCFGNSFEIIIASYLLMDDLLPLNARKAYARLTLDAMFEAEEKKCFLSSLKLSAPPPGRKESKGERGYRLISVSQLLRSGYTKSDAYALVAQQTHKSPDTIRREYERAQKKRTQNKGEISK